MEILFSMVLTQAYNVHRYVNRNRAARKLGQLEFKIAVFKGLLNHVTVRGENPPRDVGRKHHIKQYAVGSRGDGSNRRKTPECRECMNSVLVDGEIRLLEKRTTYYCTVCRVAFHPECFVKWHIENSRTYVHAKQDLDLP